MEQLLRSVKLEQLDADLFRSVMLWTPRMGRGTFGGQLVAHSFAAAQATVDSALGVHSLHGHFLQAGNSKKPIYYRVRNIRTGKSFATRIVIATQDGQAVYTATVSFHRKETPGISHSPVMPNHVPPPEEAVLDNFIARPLSKSSKESLKENVDRKTPNVLPFEIRYVIPESIRRMREEKEKEKKLAQEGKGDDRSDSSVSDRDLILDEALYSWQRTPYTGDDPHIHQLIAAFMSDFTLLFSAVATHIRAARNTAMMASLDHAIYFHAPLRVDQWFLYEVRSTWANGNRALCHGRIYNSEGELAMSTVQEGVIRMNKDFSSSSVKISSKL